MKHTDWLRLQTEGEKLCALLRQHHYQCFKQPHRLSWKINKDGKTYLLTWLPAPVGDWGLLPNHTTSARRTLWQLIQSILNIIRGNEATNQAIPLSADLTRPWAIVRLLPNAQRYTIARFPNRQDAQDYIRFLNRFVLTAEFELLFDVSPKQL
ncbi:MAG: hypothetical protein RIM23_00695 [Coleofasciculus sp. G3-WIS-01]|uniref:hypothetical protein n=1 Tax=Coleofasciculus sp. G3-WIS-01 TaxID=3069528 RepID=UPI0032FB3191